jgi:beta-lactamase regulating signal transducer with metallopeptidase domain
MKHITKLGNNRYIHLDSYGEYRSSISKLLMTTFVLAIAAITAGAIVGIDITNPTPTQQQSK